MMLLQACLPGLLDRGRRLYPLNAPCLKDNATLTPSSPPNQDATPQQSRDTVPLILLHLQRVICRDVLRDKVQTYMDEEPPRRVVRGGI